MINIIVSTYKQNHDKGLPRLLNSLVRQTDKQFIVWVVHDGPDIDNSKVLVDSYKKSLHIDFFETYTRENCFGHNCREEGLGLVSLREDLLNKVYNISYDAYIQFTNGDNEYFPFAIEVFNKLSLKRDKVLLAEINHSYFNYGVLPVQFKEAYCDFMNMCIRSDVMKKMGFPYRDFASDAHMIRDLNLKYNNISINKSKEIIGIHH